jgi:hypothetical protein
MNARAGWCIILLPLALLAGCGSGTSMQKVTNKARDAKNRVQLEEALGKPVKSETITSDGKTYEVLTFKADDGEVTYTLENDKIVTRGEVEMKKPGTSDTTEKQ